MMASKRFTILERYLERVLLAAASIFALVMVVLYGFQSPNRVEYEGRPVDPGELDVAIRRSAEQLHARVRDAAAVDANVPEHHKQLAEAHAAGILCGSSRNGIVLAAGLPRSVGFGMPIPNVPPVDPDHDIRLVSPLPLSPLMLTSGRAVVRRTTAPAVLRMQAVQSVGEQLVDEGEAVFWVSVGGLFDPAAQREAFQQARYPAFRAQVHVVGVEVQRQERLVGERFSDWQEVEPAEAIKPPAIPDPARDPRTGVVLNQPALRAALEQIKQSQTPLMRPPFREIISGSPWRMPLPEGDRPASPADTRSVPDAAPERLAVWTHDETVEPGKTYRYRLRVNLWNRYVGRPELLADPAQADQSVLRGQWSAPSEPITVPPDTHFFVCGAQPNKRLASVEVWKWHMGNWLRQRFQVGVGDAIGGLRRVKIGHNAAGEAIEEEIDFTAQAVVLALGFDRPMTVRMPPFGNGPWTQRETKSTVVAYVDPLDGEVKQRLAALDRLDPLRRSLRKP